MECPDRGWHNHTMSSVCTTAKESSLHPLAVVWSLHRGSQVSLLTQGPSASYLSCPSSSPLNLYIRTDCLLHQTPKFNIYFPHSPPLSPPAPLRPCPGWCINPPHTWRDASLLLLISCALVSPLQSSGFSLCLLLSPSPKPMLNRNTCSSPVKDN